MPPGTPLSRFRKNRSLNRPLFSHLLWFSSQRWYSSGLHIIYLLLCMRVFILKSQLSPTVWVLNLLCSIDRSSVLLSLIFLRQGRRILYLAASRHRCSTGRPDVVTTQTIDLGGGAGARRGPAPLPFGRTLLVVHEVVLRCSVAKTTVTTAVEVDILPLVIFFVPNSSFLGLHRVRVTLLVHVLC